MLRGALQDGTYTVLVAERRRSGRSDDTTVACMVSAGGAPRRRRCRRDVRVARRSRSGAPARRFVARWRSRRRSGLRPNWRWGCMPGRSTPPMATEAAAVQQAARLAQLAAPGQILASALVRQLIGEDADLRFGEDREVSLPGLAGRMVVNEVRWGEHRRRVLRVVIADDAALVRDGVAALLRAHGVEVAGTASDAEGVARGGRAPSARRCAGGHPHAADVHRRGARRRRADPRALPGGRRAGPLAAPRRSLRAARGARQPGSDGLPAQGPRDRLACAVRRARTDRRRRAA